MESDDDFDHLISNNVSEVREAMVMAKTSIGAEESSGEDEVSVKSEMDDSDDDAGSTRMFASTKEGNTSLTEPSLLDVTIKSEPETSDEEAPNSKEKEALISQYLSRLRSEMRDGLDATSDEDDTSIKSEIDDEDVSVKSESENEEQPALSRKSENELERLDETVKDENEEEKDEEPQSKTVTKHKNKKLQKKEKKKNKSLVGENETATIGGKEKKLKKTKSKESNPKRNMNVLDETAEDERQTNNSDIDEKKPVLSNEEKKILKKQVRLEQLNGKKKKKAMVQPTQDELITKPTSRKEKELMALVFGGTSQVKSQLRKQAYAKSEDASMLKPDTNKGKEPKRKAVWHDSDDDDVDDAANMKRNKFSHQELPDQLTNERRRKEFEQIVGKPKWADLDHVKEPDSDDEILRTVGHVVKGSAAQGLPKDTIELKKLKNLNRETKAEGEISSINFHPTSMVAVITDKRGFVAIVAVDGVQNEKLHTLWLQKMRVVCSRLTPDGNELIFGSYRKLYHVYNLISGKSDTIKIPEKETWWMKNFRVSRCGKYLASAGDFGEVHLISAKSKEVLRTIQLRYPCQALEFTPDSRYLLCHSSDTEVSVYSLDARRIVNVFQDEGCVNGSCIAVCPGGQFVATGSRQGIVNIYALDATLKEQQPVPLKVINNLTTYIDSLTFNATSELLVIGSSTVKNAVKLIHVKSGTVFRNFPMQMASLGHVTTAEFSPSGGYLALGNKQGSVSLFRVKHYENY
uniref:WD repeat-containing protein 55 homolog n=1 Tax=Anopheles farauti TaxID=69004 RepID=A0A182Q9J1_9DIPT